MSVRAPRSTSTGLVNFRTIARSSTSIMHTLKTAAGLDQLVGDRPVLDPDTDQLRVEAELGDPVRRHAVAALRLVGRADHEEAGRHLPEHPPAQTVVLVALLVGLDAGRVRPDRPGTSRFGHAERLRLTGRAEPGDGPSTVSHGSLHRVTTPPGAPQARESVQNLPMSDPASETRPWGGYTVLDDADDHKVKRIVVNPGHRLSYQRHAHRAEHWFVVRGSGVVTLDGVEVAVAAGQAVDVPRGAAHRITNTGAADLVFVEVQHGDSFAESDIERLDDDYGRSAGVTRSDHQAGRAARQVIRNVRLRRTVDNGARIPS